MIFRDFARKKLTFRKIPGSRDAKWITKYHDHDHDHGNDKISHNFVEKIY